MLIPLGSVTVLVVGRRSASVWVAVYFTLLFFFPNASWGLLETAAGSNFYTRATGTLYFSAHDGVMGRELWRINSNSVAEIVETVAGNAYWIKRQRHGFPMTR